MSEDKVEIIKNLGPSVLKAKIPIDIVNKLNTYIDEVIQNREKSKSLNYGEHLVGDVTQEFKLEKKIVIESGFLNFLANRVKKWIEIETEKKISKFLIKESWVVRQFQNEYNPVHWHSGHISGAGFLKVPKILGKHVQNKKDKMYRGGHLQLVHGARMFMCKSTLNIIPEVGDFYFFPNYLMHTVYPFKDSNEERRSISFNADIDQDIYNVYGQ